MAKKKFNAKTVMARIKKQLEDYRKTESGMLSTRQITFSCFIIMELDRLKITEKEFAKKIKMKTSLSKRIIRGKFNWSLNDWVKIMNGLGYENMDIFSERNIVDKLRRRHDRN